jgi:hypothetical protein
MNIIKRVKSESDKIINRSNDLFAIERFFMDKLGMWPGGEIVKWKLVITLVVHMCMAFLPICNYAHNSIIRKNYFALAQATPDLLLSILIIFLPMTILCRSGTFRNLIKNLDTNWFERAEKQFPLWQQHREQITKNGNKRLLYILCFSCIYSFPIFYMPVIASVIKSLSNQSSESTGDEITILKIE